MNNNCRQHYVEDVQCFIEVTASLVELLREKCLRASRESICNEDVTRALASINEGAYDLIINYGRIVDTVTIIGDRLEQAACMLDSIVTSELERRK